jgi:hypothetical protein
VTDPELRDAMAKLFTGDPVEDVEIAKRLIARYPDVDIAALMAIADDQTQPQSARFAAIYTLGFTDAAGPPGRSCRGLPVMRPSRRKCGITPPRRLATRKPSASMWWSVRCGSPAD